MKDYIIAIVLATWTPYFIDNGVFYQIVEAKYKNEQKVLYWKIDDTLNNDLHSGVSLFVDDSTWNNSQNDTWSFIQHKDTAEK